MKSVITDNLEKFVNRAISLDVESSEKLSGLNGRSVSIEFINTSLKVRLLIIDSGIYLSDATDHEADVRIRGTPTQLLNYLVAMQGSNDSRLNMIEVIGDVALAQKLQNIFRNIEIGWEEQLSHWGGDYVAHKAGYIARKATKAFEDAKKTLKMDISEYLQYEKELLPIKNDVDDFNQSVDKLRNDVQRLKLRVERLQTVDRTK